MKEGQWDENEKKYIGVFLYTLEELLEPGAKKILHCKPILPLKQVTEDELIKRRIAQCKYDPKKRLQQNKKSPVPDELFLEPEEEQHPYETSKTCANFVIEMAHAIIPLIKDRPKV